MWQTLRLGSQRGLKLANHRHIASMTTAKDRKVQAKGAAPETPMLVPSTKLHASLIMFVAPDHQGLPAGGTTFVDFGMSVEARMPSTAAPAFSGRMLRQRRRLLSQ